MAPQNVTGSYEKKSVMLNFSFLTYIFELLFSCSLTRAIHLQPLKEQTRNEFIRSPKLSIARHGRPQTIYSDNAKTFTATASWIKKVVKNETVHYFLGHQKIK